MLFRSPVTVKARSFPEREFTGKVEVIYPEINKETRTARVRVELKNPDLILLHDMYIDAEIGVGNPDSVLAIPESAVLDSGVRQSVLIDKGEGRFEPREVKLGHRGSGFVEIRQGLADGDGAEIAFGNVDQRPHDGVVGDPEQDAARLDTHSLDRVALENDAVARCGPLDRCRYGSALLDG